MWGFKPLGSSDDLICHRKKLEGKLPVKYHEDLNCVYKWVSDKNFQNALKVNTLEQWKYCKNVMSDPPDMYIDKQIEKAGNILFTENKIEYNHKVCTPECRICKEKLSDNVDSKLQYCILSCPCGRMYCHLKCADQYLLKTPSCFVCKQYLIYDKKNSTLRSTFAHR